MRRVEGTGRPELAARVALSGTVLVLQSRVLVRAQELIRCRPRRQLLLLLLLLLLIEAVEPSIELLQNIIFGSKGFRQILGLDICSVSIHMLWLNCTG